MLATFRRSFLPATWLGWQVESNWTDPFLFLVFSVVKPVAGVLWEAGAISTAEWKGVRLAEILGRVGPKDGAKHIWFEGLDSITLKDRQTLFGGQVPIEKAMRSETIVALEMNGTPLPREHGFPARTIVPGYIGARSVKWLGRIVVSDKKSDNNFVARDYKMFPPDALRALAADSLSCDVTETKKLPPPSVAAAGAV